MTTPQLHLDLTLLALQALANLSNEDIWATVVSLRLELDLGDRQSWEQLRQGHPALTQKLTQQRQQLILSQIICTLAQEHQETIRRAIALLEQYTQLERPAREAVLLSEYLQRFKQGYLQRSLGTLKLTLVESLALKLLVDLLFFIVVPMAIAICRGDWMSALPKDAVMLHLRSVCLNDSDEWRSAMAEGHWSGRMWSTRLERSYTPPTCRLTVVGRRSLWSSRQRPRLLNVRFELRLDDPRLPDQDQKRVSGDQAQLFHLSQLVCSYVQGVLSQSHEYLEALSSPLTPSYGTEGQRGAMTQPVGTTIAAISPPRAATYMEPQGLTAHNLVLGTLATPDSGPVIRLGTLQLFDVLCALESFFDGLGIVVGPEPGEGRPPRLAESLSWARGDGGVSGRLSSLG